MQIILQEDIDKLGHRGDVVTVKPGYARNYLLPRNLAIEATPGNMNALERIRTSLAKKTATELEAATKEVDQVVTLVRAQFKRNRSTIDKKRAAAIASTIRSAENNLAEANSDLPPVHVPTWKLVNP